MENINLRKRFVSDFNLPIQVLQSPYFENYLERYEEMHGAKTKWDELIDVINSRFSGNAEEWLSYYATVRDNIITTIENSDSYKEFCCMNMDGHKKCDLIKCGDVSIYNESNVGKTFLSIDMKKANFQALKYINPNIVLGYNTYEDFVNHFTDSQYIVDSKYTRQVIFGKLNPKRTIQVEQFLMSQFALTKEIEFLKDLYGRLISFKSDEIVYDVTGMDMAYLGFETGVMIGKIKDIWGIDVRVEVFDLKLFKFVDHRGGIIPVYEKDMISCGRNQLKSAPMTFYPQIHRIYNGEVVQDIDLVFYHEHQLAKFMHPIKLM